VFERRRKFIKSMEVVEGKVWSVECGCGQREGRRKELWGKEEPVFIPPRSHTACAASSGHCPIHMVVWISRAAMSSASSKVIVGQHAVLSTAAGTITFGERPWGQMASLLYSLGPQKYLSLYQIVLSLIWLAQPSMDG
jgi:hypothetical protein